MHNKFKLSYKDLFKLKKKINKIKNLVLSKLFNKGQNSGDYIVALPFGILIIVSCILFMICILTHKSLLSILLY